MTRIEKFTTVAFWVIIDLVAAYVVYEALRYGIRHSDRWSIAWAAALCAIAVVCTYLGFRSLRKKDKGSNAAV